MLMADAWNSFKTDQNDGMTTEVITYKAGNGDAIHAYFARPTGNGPFPGIVLVHHMPGWDEYYRETARRFAQHGYLTICPDLYCRAGHGTPDDVTAKVRDEGGVADSQVVADLDAAKEFLKSQSNCNGKIGITGTCSGGRYTFLAACTTKGWNAAVECWGGAVVMTPDQLNDKRPVAPIDKTADLCCPLLGLFGNEDRAPNPEQVNQHEEALKKAGKDYEFHRYDGAGHGFFYYHAPAYRQEQAMDGWAKLLGFFDKHLR
jgi:carboxymethylenebutenolidase